MVAALTILLGTKNPAVAAWLAAATAIGLGCVWTRQRTGVVALLAAIAVQMLALVVVRPDKSGAPLRHRALFDVPVAAAAAVHGNWPVVDHAATVCTILESNRATRAVALLTLGPLMGFLWAGTIPRVYWKHNSFTGHRYVRRHAVAREPRTACRRSIAR